MLTAKKPRRAVANPVPDIGSDIGHITAPGTRIYNRDQSQFGVVQYLGPDYYGEAGHSQRVVVLWPDNRITKPTTKGIQNRNGRWTV